jgi:uroporphyrinogen-III synthase
LPCEKPRILLLRPNPPEPGELGEAGIVAAIPVAAIEADEKALELVERELPHCDWLVLTSPRAPSLLKPLASMIGELVASGRLRVAAVGPKTADAIRRVLGVEPSLVPREYRGATLADQLAPLRPSCVLAARSERGVRELVDKLAAAGVRVVEVHLYRLRILDDMASLAGRIADEFDYIVVTSPSIAEALAKHYQGGSVTVVAIGPTTAEALRRHGFQNVLVAREYTLKGVAETIAGDWASRKPCK